MEQINPHKAKNLFNQWKEYAKINNDQPLLIELNKIENDPIAMDDFFGSSLSFGTSGLRGKIGPGPNGMNLPVIRRTSLGVARYLNNQKKHQNKDLSVIVAYDSRLMSKEMAETTAKVLSASGIKVYLFREVTAVPILVFSIAQLKATMGIMITASHNPKEFNGYKVYNEDGYQIIGDVAKEVLEEINQINFFQSIDENDSNITYLDNQLMDIYVEQVITAMKEFQLDSLPQSRTDIVYTPLNGAGGLPVTKIISRFPQINLIPVESQWDYDGNFPTCAKPNPEIKSAFIEAKKVARLNKVDIMMATDPDSDRLGVAIMKDDDFQLLTGNEIGALILDFFVYRLGENKVKDKLVLKSIVSSPIIEAMAKEYQFKVETKLTGFKYIGERMAQLQETGDKDKFLFAFEESNGFLVSPFIRDKDGISAAIVICLIASYYNALGISLVDAVNKIYKKYNISFEQTDKFEFHGQGWRQRRKKFMNELRQWVKTQDLTYIDYKEGYNNLPTSDVLRIENKDEIIIVRPSGTEPLVKFYSFGRNQSADLKKQLEALLSPYLDYSN